MTARWEQTESLPPGGRISAYVHWTGMWALGAQPLSTQTLLGAQTPWLARAVTRALGPATAPWGRLLSAILPPHALPGASRAATGRAGPPPDMPPRAPLARNRVLVGIIDEATAFAHERFRMPDGRSRVDYLWLQGAPHRGGPRDTPFGRELHRDEITALMDAHSPGPPGSPPDEESLYRACGALDMSLGLSQSLARRAGHGTAVSDLASGFGAAQGMARRGSAPAAAVPNADLPESMSIDPDLFDLALVSLPEKVVMDTSGTFVEIFVILGILRLIEHAERIAGSACPLVINISLGLTAGPRDGTSLLDRFISAIEAERPADRAPIHVIMPSGNFRQARVHAKLDAPLDAAAAPLYWNLLPDDPSPSFLEIWSQPLDRKPAGLPLSIGFGPPGRAPAPMPADAALDGVFDLSGQEGVLARCYTHWLPEDPGAPDLRGRVCVTLAMAPTVPDAPGAACARPGRWQLRITPRVGPEAAPDGQACWPLDLMVQRDDMIPGYRGGGRQSHLDDPRYVLRDARGAPVTDDPPAPPGARAHVRRSGTINAMATAPETMVVGGCYGDTLEPVDFSGEGGDGPGAPRGVDVTAPAKRSRSGGALRAAGTRSGSRIGILGTSVAAPVLAREISKVLHRARVEANLLRSQPPMQGLALHRPDSDASAPPALLSVGEELAGRFSAPAEAAVMMAAPAEDPAVQQSPVDQTAPLTKKDPKEPPAKGDL